VTVPDYAALRTQSRVTPAIRGNARNRRVQCVSNPGNVHRDQTLWVEGQRERAVDAFRCQKCGFLELYATDKRSDFLV